MLRTSRPGRRRVRLASALALGVSGLALSACEPRPQQAPPATAASPPATADVLTPPRPPAPVDRAELLQALAAARSAYAAGQPPADSGLAGRRFAIRQAFGCNGPSVDGAPAAPGLAQWSWGPRRQTIEISLTPADWAAPSAAVPPAAAVPLAAADWEAVEGYWLARPWLLADGCPAVRADAAAPAIAMFPAPLVSGLAAVFPHGGSRLDRRDGKAFTATVRGEEPLAAPVGGFRLVIEGRFAAFPDGGAIRCHGAAPDQAPVCIAAAEVDRVAFEDAQGKLLKEWRQG